MDIERRMAANLERRSSLLLALAAATVGVGSGGNLALIGPATAAQQADPLKGEDVRKAVTTFLTGFEEAYNRKDAAKVAAFYAENGVLVPPGPIASGRSSIEKAWQAVLDSGRTGLHYELQQADSDGMIVWSLGQFTVMVPDENKKLQERRGNFAQIYQRENETLMSRVHVFNFLPPTRPT